jgi:hypothetical protein
MTVKEQIVLSVARDFSRTPGPRRVEEGKYSGDEFLQLLRDRFDQAVSRGVTLLVDLDGAAGYATSFLEAAFGGLARERDQNLVEQTLQFKSLDEPDLEEEIRQYIREANN